MIMFYDILLRNLLLILANINKNDEMIKKKK